MAEDTLRQVLFIRTELEAAVILGVGCRTLQRWRAVGGGPAYVRLSNRRLGYTQDDLRAFAERRTFMSLGAEHGEDLKLEKHP